MFLENLNKKTPEENLHELFGLRNKHNLRGNYCVNILLSNSSLLRLCIYYSADHVCTELNKLNGIDWRSSSKVKKDRVLILRKKRAAVKNFQSPNEGKCSSFCWKSYSKRSHKNIFNTVISQDGIPKGILCERVKVTIKAWRFWV